MPIGLNDFLQNICKEKSKMCFFAVEGNGHARAASNLLIYHIISKVHCSETISNIQVISLGSSFKSLTKTYKLFPKVNISDCSLELHSWDTDSNIISALSRVRDLISLKNRRFHARKSSQTLEPNRAVVIDSLQDIIQNVSEETFRSFLIEIRKLSSCCLIISRFNSATTSASIRSMVHSFASVVAQVETQESLSIYPPWTVRHEVPNGAACISSLRVNSMNGKTIESVDAMVLNSVSTVLCGISDTNANAEDKLAVQNDFTSFRLSRNKQEEKARVSVELPFNLKSENGDNRSRLEVLIDQDDLDWDDEDIGDADDDLDI